MTDALFTAAALAAGYYLVTRAAKAVATFLCRRHVRRLMRNRADWREYAAGKVTLREVELRDRMRRAVETMKFKPPEGGAA